MAGMSRAPNNRTGGGVTINDNITEYALAAVRAQAKVKGDQNEDDCVA